jgi:hypothetical protein
MTPRLMRLAGESLYSPSFREGVFSETRLLIYFIPRDSVSIVEGQII